MNLPLVLRLGLKISVLKSPNRFIALTSKLAILGITLGVATLMTVIAVMQGFENEIRHSLIQDTEHLRISPLVGELPENTKQEVAELAHVKDVVGINESYGLIQTYRSFMPIMLISYDSEDTILSHGADLKKDGIYLYGDASLYFDTGDELSLLIPSDGSLPIPKSVQVQYLGGVKNGPAVGKSLMVGLLSSKTYRENIKNQPSAALVVMVDDLYATTALKKQIEQKYGGMLQTVDWKDRYRAFFTALRLQRNVMAFILSMITIVAMFSLISGLVMLSAEKRKQIALLQTMGLSSRKTAQIFFIQGFFISCLGIALGVMLGVLLCYYAQDITYAIEQVLGYQLVDEAIYGISYLPTDLSLKLIITIVGYSLLLGSLASTYPALRASRLQPAKVLRYG